MTTASTTRRPRGNRAAETAARRARLIRAASELAAEGGYDAVQMRDVAARAEVALGTLYRHYSSKDQLLIAALAEQATTLRERADNRGTRGDTPAVRVAEVLQRASRALERQPRVTAAMVTAMSKSNDARAAVLKDEVGTTLRGIIADAVDGGNVPHFDDAQDLDDIVQVLGAVWYAELSFWVGGTSTADEMADRLARAAQLLLDHRA